MGMWAVVATVVMTAAQPSTTLGPSGQSGSGVDVWSDVVIPLGAVLVGALASLAGSILVNRWQLRKNARLEVWENILPAIRDLWGIYEVNIILGENLPSPPPIQKQLDALGRKVVLLKRPDKKAYDALYMASVKWSMLRTDIEPLTKEEVEEQPEVVDYKPVRAAEQDFHRKLWDYCNYVEKKLQPYHWRVVFLFSRLLRKLKKRKR
jgi:hypothetical protein